MNKAKPRWETQPTKGSKLRKGMKEAALELGFTPMPWQGKPIRLLSELRPPTEEERDQFGPLVAKGVPRYRQVLVTVPRQSGKSTIAQAFVKSRAEEAPDQKVFGTSKTRDDARVWQAELSLLLPDVHFTTAAGRETITWPNGSSYSIFAPNKKGGHGASVSGAVLIDEAWTLTSEVMQGIVPAMAAHPLAQMLVVTSMGDMDSHVWNGLVKVGRAATEDPDAQMAYIEYSAENPEDVFNPDKWGEWMPALGLTISKEAIRADMALMEADPNEGTVGIVRAYGNITTSVKVSIFSMDQVARAWSIISPPPRFVLTVDVNDEPRGASVASGHLVDGGVAARVIEWRYGPPTWLPQVVGNVLGKREVEAIVGDFGGPAKAVQAELVALSETYGVPLVDRKPMELAGDTQRFVYGLKEGTIFLEKSEPLLEAIEGARSRDIGDGAWLVSRRKMMVDASPLISVIMAHGVAEELAIKPVREFFAF